MAHPPARRRVRDQAVEMCSDSGSQPLVPEIGQRKFVGTSLTPARRQVDLKEVSGGLGVRREVS